MKKHPNISNTHWNEHILLSLFFCFWRFILSSLVTCTPQCWLLLSHCVCYLLFKRLWIGMTIPRNDVFLFLFPGILQKQHTQQNANPHKASEDCSCSVYSILLVVFFIFRLYLPTNNGYMCNNIGFSGALESQYCIRCNFVYSLKLVSKSFSCTGMCGTIKVNNLQLHTACLTFVVFNICMCLLSADISCRVLISN